MEAKMILSYKNKFIFIRNAKVAGTSVEIALSSICGDKDIITPTYARDELIRIENYNSSCRNYTNKYDEIAYKVLLNDIIKCGDHKIKSELLSTVNIPNKERALYSGHMHLSDVIARANIVTDKYLLIYTVRNPYDQLISFAEWRLMDYNRYGNTRKYDHVDIKNYLSSNLNEIILFSKENIIRTRYLSNVKFAKTKVLRYETLKHDFDDLIYMLGYPRIALPHAKCSQRDK